MSKFNEVLNKKAVALSYDEKKNAAPVIVASGMGYLAEKMVELAQECGVPVYFLNYTGEKPAETVISQV